MISVSNNAITMTRGDTLVLDLHLTKDDEEYVPKSGDYIRFAMSKKFLSESGYELILTKEIPTDSLQLQLDPEDTKDLAYGSYNYDIQLTDASGDVDTFILSKITITKEVE